MGLEVDTSGDEPVVLDSRVFHGFLNTTGLQEYLADQIRVESVLLDWLKTHPPTPTSRLRKLRRRAGRWFVKRRPTLHLGPCDHADCY